MVLVDGCLGAAVDLEQVSCTSMVPFEVPLGVAPAEEQAADVAEDLALAGGKG
jgi:hypothetical protein